MDVRILTVREQFGCDQILEMSVNGDETYLQGVANELEGEVMDWIELVASDTVWIAYSTKKPKHIYQVMTYEAVDLTP